MVGWMDVNTITKTNKFMTFINSLAILLQHGQTYKMHLRCTSEIILTVVTKNTRVNFVNVFSTTKNNLIYFIK